MMIFGRKIVVLGSMIVLLWIVIGILVYRSVYQIGDESMRIVNPGSSEKRIDDCKNQKYSSDFWKTVNLYEKNIPSSINESQSAMVIQSNAVTVQGSKIHYIFAMPNTVSSSTISVLLLHGQSFTSETWKKLGTIRILAALGFFPVAVDLPGYGSTPSISSLNKASFIRELISELNLKKPVLISPSMSGSFSLKFLIEHQDELGGFIPVSPVQTDILDKSPCKPDKEENEKPLNKDCQRIKHLLTKHPNLSCIKVPSLIVWGEKDRGENSAKLCLLPESQGAEIPEGNHPAYLSNPELWHKLLYNFLSALNETRICRQN